MSTPEHRDHIDPASSQPADRKRLAMIVGAVLVLIAVIVALHLTGVIGG
jgi:flagellar biosynthesis/type III secretory pathway M-ring protein FliF/YscJ